MTIERATPGAPADPGLRRKSSLLAAFLVVMAVLFAVTDGVSLLTRPGYEPPWAGYLFLAGAWLLDRSGHYHAAAALTLTMFPAVIFSQAAHGSSASAASSFAFLLLGLIVASILLPMRGLLLVAALNLAGVALMPRLAPQAVPPLSRLTGSLVLLAIGAGLLAVSMRHRDQLEAERQAQLRDGEERLRLALRAARMLTWDWDVGSGRLRWSGEAGGSLGQVLSGQEPFSAYLQRVHEHDRPAIEETLRRALSGEPGPFVVRHRVSTPDGSLRWIEAHGQVDRDAAGQALRMRGTVFDVTGQQQAEAEREALLRELAAKNAELERFTYTASHDLKSPLVTVRGFLGFIEKDVREGNQERLHADLRRVREATEKMGRLLDELLELSRVGRVMNPPQAVPLVELARDAASLVAGRIEQRGVQVQIADDLPVVWGDRVRLRQVLQNLLDNAVKFLGDQPEPRVEIGCRRVGGEAVCTVRDNGVGIEERHRERVFGLFDKLDPDSEGTGVGLALVRRIVELHGGRVWAESEGAGRGTTICFTLPPPPGPAQPAPGSPRASLAHPGEV